MDADKQSLMDAYLDGVDAYLDGGTVILPYADPLTVTVSPLPVVPERACMAARCPTCPFNADKRPFREYLVKLLDRLPPWLHSAVIIDEVDAALMVLVVIPVFVCHYDLTADNYANLRTVGGLLSMRSCAGANLALAGEAEEVPAMKRARRLLAAKRNPLRAERRMRLKRLFDIAFQMNANAMARVSPESDAGLLVARYEQWIGSE
jgi:hypothetical protein